MGKRYAGRTGRNLMISKKDLGYTLGKTFWLKEQ